LVEEIDEKRRKEQVRYLITGEQISFFERYGYVELEGVFFESVMQRFEQEIRTELRRRGSLFQEEEAKRDLSLSSAFLKKNIASLQIAKIVSSLIRQKPLRFAFDHYLEGIYPGEYIPSEKTICVGPLAAFLLLCLKGPSEIVREEAKPFELNVPPQKTGSLTIFSSSTLIRPSQHYNGEYFLFGYGHSSLLYRDEIRDPCRIGLKRFGYALNDRLKSTTHPIFYF
jgi:hypothetical protein